MALNNQVRHRLTTNIIDSRKIVIEQSNLGVITITTNRLFEGQINTSKIELSPETFCLLGCLFDVADKEFNINKERILKNLNAKYDLSCEVEYDL